MKKKQCLHLPQAIFSTGEKDGYVACGMTASTPAGRVLYSHSTIPVHTRGPPTHPPEGPTRDAPGADG